MNQMNRILLGSGKIGLSSLLALGLCSGSALATPNAAQVHELATPGTQVASMPSIGKIQDWHALDSYHVVVQVANHGHYRLTLNDACHRLRWASDVAISGSQNQVWAGFDYLTADGQQCSIQSIERL